MSVRGTIGLLLILLIVQLLSFNIVLAAVDDPDREIEESDLLTCDTTMELIKLNGTSTVSCADGSDPGYYLSLPDNVANPDKLIIWLGDGMICGTEEGCDTGLCERTSFTEEEALTNCTGTEMEYSRLKSRKLFSNAEPGLTDLELVRCKMLETPCSSNEWNETINGETVMCGDDDTFGDFIRVFVPHCTADWFLGRGSTPNPSSTKFKGADVFDEVIEDLIERLNIGSGIGATELTKVVLGGTGGGGLGALHNFRRMDERLVPDVGLAIIDSSWLLDIERFSYQERFDGVNRNTLDAYIRNNSLDWIESAAFDKSCVDTFGKNTITSRRCFYISEVLQSRDIPTESGGDFTLEELVLFSRPILMIQSQYDFAWLDRLMILDDSDELIPQRYENDERTYINALRGYVEAFGSNLRANVFDIQRLMERESYSNVRFYTTSCEQHGYVAPTSLSVFSTRLERIGRSGELAFNRTGTTWGKLEIRGETVEAAIKDWVNTNGAYDVNDRHQFELCGSALCNPTCPSNVRSFILLDIWSSCSQNLVVAYSYFVIAAFWLVFILSAITVCHFRNKTNKYWQKVKEE
jgi:hypothetical protein